MRSVTPPRKATGTIAMTDDQILDFVRDEADVSEERGLRAIEDQTAD